VGLDGHILASSSPADVGLHVSLQALGYAAGAGNETLGDTVAGRGMASIAIDGPHPPTPAGLGFIPLLHRTGPPGAAGLLLVGQVNPDVIATYAQAALEGEDPRSVAMLVSYRSRLMAATRQARLGPGTTVAQDLVRQVRFAGVDHATFSGRGLDDARSIITVRAARELPMMVLIERPYETLVDTWWATIRWVVLFALVGVGFIGVMTGIAFRSLRARERSRQQLDAAHRRIAHRERELSVLVTSVQEIIFRTDAQGRIGFVNTRWHAVDARGPEAARGRLLHDLVTPADARIVRRLFAEHDSKGVRTARAGLGEDAAGPRIFDIAVVPLRSGNTVVGFAGSAIDITERQRAEQKLREQLSFSALLLEVCPLPVCLEDTAGRLIAVNHAWEAFMGESREDAIGQPAHRYLPAPADPLDRLEGGERERHEIRVRHRDTSLRDLAVTRVGVEDDNGEVVATLSLAIDVSEYREAERATREARDAAEETSRAKSEFIANISHEMRTPLQSIMGFSELGLLRVDASGAIGSMFEDIHAAGQRMLSVVNDLLDVSKIESTVGTFHLERVDLRVVARAVAREVQPLLAARQLVLNSILSDEPLLAKVDPSRIQQVLRNMLANAIKFSPIGGTVELRGEIDPQGPVHFCVVDAGPGVPQAELERIFEPFVQSTLTKDGSGGTGLGLAICRKIIDAHGGRMAARNVRGGGSAFEVWLPYNNSSETRPVALDELTMGA
jgi:PAS domain S-box-containing protein